MTVQTMSFEESVRKRPFMFIGNNGLIDLFKGLVIDYIELCKTDEITFQIIILEENSFSIKVASSKDIRVFKDQFNNESTDYINYFPKVLRVISKKFDLKFTEKKNLEINFSINKNIILNTDFDYLKLNEKIMQLALLNRQCELITIDKRQKYVSQNYFHFPEGVFYLFDRINNDALSKPEFILTFDDRVDSISYQIGISYRTDWYPQPNIFSFANDVHTIHSGSLVDGILDGIVSATKSYVNENNLTHFKVTRKKFYNGLIIVCAVRGENFKYGGSFKETLENESVKKEAKKIVSKLALQFFENNKEQTNKFMFRFDTTQFTSSMY